MAVKTNNPNQTFRINAEKKYYPIKEETWIKKGDVLYFEKIDETVYITNDISDSNVTNAIAIFGGSPLEIIPCYVINS